MSFDGSHLICKKCSEIKSYSVAGKKWVCSRCELDELDIE